MKDRLSLKDHVQVDRVYGIAPPFSMIPRTEGGLSRGRLLYVLHKINFSLQYKVMLKSYTM